MGQDISILQAATLWFSGELPKHVTLWGCPLTFCDRLGQVIEFVGALAVVVDLMWRGSSTASTPISGSS